MDDIYGDMDARPTMGASMDAEPINCVVGDGEQKDFPDLGYAIIAKRLKNTKKIHIELKAIPKRENRVKSKRLTRQPKTS